MRPRLQTVLRNLPLCFDTPCKSCCESLKPWASAMLTFLSCHSCRTVGKALAVLLACEFLDADDFHSIQNKGQMHRMFPTLLLYAQFGYVFTLLFGCSTPSCSSFSSNGLSPWRTNSVRAMDFFCQLLKIRCSYTSRVLEALILSLLLKFFVLKACKTMFQKAQRIEGPQSG